MKRTLLLAATAAAAIVATVVVASGGDTRAPAAPAHRTTTAPVEAAVEPGPTAPESTPATLHTAPMAPLASGWRVGDERRYRYHSDQQTTLELGDTPPQRVDLKVDGEAVFTCVSETDDGVLLRLSLESPRVRSDLPSVASAETRATVAAPCFIALGADGAITKTWFADDADITGRAILKQLAAATQVVRGRDPEARTWTAREADVTGTLVVDYVRANERALTKTFTRYERVVRSGAALPMMGVTRHEVDGAATLRLDATDLITSVYVDVVTRSEQRDMKLVSSTATRARLDLLVARHRDDVKGLAATRDGLTAFGLTETGSGRDFERLGDETRVAGATVAELLAAVDAASVDETRWRDRAALLSRVSAALRLRPGAAKDVVARIRRDPAGQAAQTLVGALVGAGTAESQAGLVDLFTDETLDADVRNGVLAISGLAKSPRAGLGEALVAALDDEGLEEGAAALSLGSYVQNANGSSEAGAADADAATADGLSLLIERLDTAQTDDERVMWLMALGNTGDVRALPVLARYLTGGSLPVRVAAVGAHRFIPGEVVDATLMAALADAEPEIQGAAVACLPFRDLVIYEDALAGVLATSPSPQLRLVVVHLLGNNIESFDAADLALERVAEADVDPQVRTAAAEIIAALQNTADAAP